MQSWTDDEYQKWKASLPTQYLWWNCSLKTSYPGAVRTWARWGIRSGEVKAEHPQLKGGWEWGRVPGTSGRNRKCWCFWEVTVQSSILQLSWGHQRCIGLVPYFPWTTEFFHFGGKWFLGVNGSKMWPGLLAGRSSVKADGHSGIEN